MGRCGFQTGDALFRFSTARFRNLWPLVVGRLVFRLYQGMV